MNRGVNFTIVICCIVGLACAGPSGGGEPGHDVGAVGPPAEPPTGYRVDGPALPTGHRIACRDEEPEDQCGILDVAGRWTFGPAPAHIDDAGEGLVRVRAEDQDVPDEVAKRLRTRTRWRYVDPATGAVVAGPFLEATRFAEGRAWVRGDATWRLPEDGSYRGDLSLVDARGQVVRAFGSELWDAGPFSDGLAPAYLAVPAEPGEDLPFAPGAAGYLGPDGSWKVPAQFDEAGPFAGGRARVRTTEGRELSVDSTGAAVSP